MATKRTSDYLINAKPVETMDTLASNANAAAIVTKFNDLIGRMITAGLMYAKRAIAYVLTNLTQTSQPTEATGDSDVTITLTADTGYVLPTADGIKVKCGAKTLVEGSGNDYVYTRAAGTIAIEKEAILDDITVIGSGYRGVTQTLTHATSDNSAPAVPDGGYFKAIYTAGEGYSLPTTVTVTLGGEAAETGDYAWDKDNGVLEVFKVTAALVVTVTATA